MTLRAVFLNDTSGNHHFGCARVMRTIEAALQARGIEVTAKSLVRQDWERDTAFLRALGAADIIVINGEGTLHHGSRHAEKLLRVVRHPNRKSIPVVVLNALFQDNPPEWDHLLAGMSLISVRDSRSFAELKGRYPGELHQTLDFSLYEPFVAGSSVERTSLIVGDSVFTDVTEELATLSDKSAADIFLPIVRTIKSSRPQLSPARRRIREAVIFMHRIVFGLRHPKARFCQDEFDYLTELSKGELHVTGRFHSVCFSLLTLTPFLALSSNSWKVEALIEDLGLSSDRLMALKDIRQAIDGSGMHGFSDAELLAIENGLEGNRRAISRVFDRVAELAAGDEARKISSLDSQSGRMAARKLAPS
ncbi:polysaccharide pyruvyl transferase [Hoeflea marina]|uniref:Polysaccharide pyruvyl transferase n=1 Tax=Hoeflea marina TaxID=274592 RepID=A0A317PMB2_9HYPH|nr:polysaccharide pyruvyl transferase family protein [Hoeflea marina]PWW02075.1 polysaccharide pyruvyl transferase [Hoeflea marina]